MTTQTASGPRNNDGAGAAQITRADAQTIATVPCAADRASLLTAAASRPRGQPSPRPLPRAQWPAKCPHCDSQRHVTTEQGLRRCPTCHPLVAAPLPSAPGPIAEWDTTASPSTLRAADLIIRHTAENRRELSSNDTRELMDASGIPRPIRGARFAAAAAAGLIEPIGDVASTDPANHGKPVKIYRSLCRLCGQCETRLDATLIRAGYQTHPTCEWGGS